VTARVIANRSSYMFKERVIREMVEKLREVIACSGFFARPKPSRRRCERARQALNETADRAAVGSSSG
jgi:hypothetical protein